MDVSQIVATPTLISERVSTNGYRSATSASQFVTLPSKVRIMHGTAGCDSETSTYQIAFLPIAYSKIVAIE